MTDGSLVILMLNDLFINAVCWLLMVDSDRSFVDNGEWQLKVRPCGVQCG